MTQPESHRDTRAAAKRKPAVTAASPSRPPSAVSPQAKGVPAVRRAVAILGLLAGQQEPMTLSQIAQATSILPGSCLQILRELALARLLTFDSRHKTYRLGRGLVELARAVSRQDPFAEAAAPHLQEIAELYGMTATATAMCDDEHVACVALAQPPVAMSLHVTLGGRVPLLSGAAGRCYAAYGGHTRPMLRRWFTKVRWQVPLGFEKWLAEVAQVSACGWAQDTGAFSRGVTTLAVPVFAPGGSIRGVIGVGVVSEQLDERLKARTILKLKRAAADVGAQL
jgi:DNA-binding IclR family transcriptional regulator